MLVNGRPSNVVGPLAAVQPEHQPHRGGLAGAVGAEEPGDLPGRTSKDRSRHRRLAAVASCSAPGPRSAPWRRSCQSRRDSPGQKAPPDAKISCRTAGLSGPVEFAGCPPPPRARSPTSSAAGPTSSSPRCSTPARPGAPAPPDSSQLAGAGRRPGRRSMRALDLLDRSRPRGARGVRCSRRRPVSTGWPGWSTRAPHRSTAPSSVCSGWRCSGAPGGAAAGHRGRRAARLAPRTASRCRCPACSPDLARRRPRPPRPPRRARRRRDRHRVACPSPCEQAARAPAAGGARRPRGERHVVSVDVRLALRGGRTTREPVDEVPALATDRAWRRPRSTGRRRARRSRRYAASSCCSTTGAPHPPAALRSGGLGVRDLKAAAARLHVDEAAGRAGRRGRRGGRAARAPAPTPTATRSGCRPTPSTPGRAGRRPSAGRRWRGPGWTSRRLPGLVGSRDAAGKARQRARPRARPASCPVETRRMALDELADAARRPGAGHRHRAAVAGRPARLAAARAARAPAPTRWRWALDEAATLGLTGLGGLRVVRPGAARRRRRRGRRCSRRCCPRPVDHVLIQADLTAVAPGPLEADAGPPAAAARRRRVARRGHRLPVHRRRRCAARSTPAGRRVEIHEFLARRSRAPRCRSR